MRVDLLPLSMNAYVSMLFGPDVTRTGTSLNNVDPIELLFNARLTSDALSTVEDVVAVV